MICPENTVLSFTVAMNKVQKCSARSQNTPRWEHTAQSGTTTVDDYSGQVFIKIKKYSTF